MSTGGSWGARIPDAVVFGLNAMAKKDAVSDPCDYPDDATVTITFPLTAFRNDDDTPRAGDIAVHSCPTRVPPFVHHFTSKVWLCQDQVMQPWPADKLIPESEKGKGRFDRSEILNHNEHVLWNMNT